MAILDILAFVLEMLLVPEHLVLIALATMFGLVIGMVPGLGSAVALALLIPLTFGMDPPVAFMILAAALGGVNFGGSVSAILINTPGAAPNAATLLDGYPMTRDGRAGEAIGASAMASAMGALVGLVVLTLSIPVLLQLVFLFGPTEIFWLVVWGLTIVAVVVKGNTLAGLTSAGVGLLFSFHGLNPLTSTVRWDYGFSFLRGGMDIVAVLIGLFAIAEIANLLTRGETIADVTDTEYDLAGQWKGAREVLRHKWLFLRSAAIGSIIGMAPGAGGTVANYVAYFQAVQTSKDSDSFGEGDVRGVIASEASNDAKDGTAFMPTLGFGIPGSVSMAVILGAFVMHGITPGPLLLRDNMEVVAMIVAALLISNVLTSTVGMLSAGWLIKIPRIDIKILSGIVLAVAFTGMYAMRNNVFDLFIALAFALIGFLMIKSEMSRVPFTLGFVLGPIVEANFFRTLQISRGDYGVFLFESPIVMGLIVLTIVSLLWPVLQRRDLVSGIDTGGDLEDEL